MYYSHSLEDNKFDFFVSFLGYILKGDNRYKALVQPILKDAQDLANGNKDFYTIDRDTFPIVVYLVEKERDYFRGLNLETLSIDNYNHILQLVNERELAAL